jgi:hypothetical protein
MKQGQIVKQYDIQYFGLMLGDIEPEPHKNLRDQNYEFNFSFS